MSGFANEETIFEGPLEKEGKIAKATKARWFVLTPSMLMYFTSQSKSEKKETMLLSTDTIISQIETQVSLSRSNKKFKFTIHGVDINHISLSMTLVSSDESVINTWIAKINEVKSLNDPTEGTGKKSESSGKGPSTSLRMQKFVASRLSGSAAGQGLISSAVDDNSRNIIGAFIGGVKQFAGEAESLRIKEHCFKIATKLAIMHQSKEMQGDDFTVVSQFLEGITMTLSRVLMQFEDAVEPITPEQLDKNIAKIVTQIERFHDGCLPILQKYMKESNSARLTYLKDFFIQKEFLKCVLVDESYEDMRTTLKDVLYAQK